MADARTRDSTRIQDRLGWRLVVAGRIVRTMADEMLAEHGVGGQALGVILRLAEEDGLTQVELARRQRVEAPTMCRMVDRLEGTGLVARERHPDDRRALRIVLTARGRDLARQGLEAVEQLEELAFGSLEPAERATLSMLLGRVLDSLPMGERG